LYDEIIFKLTKAIYSRPLFSKTHFEILVVAGHMINNVWDNVYNNYNKAIKNNTRD